MAVDVGTAIAYLDLDVSGFRSNLQMARNDLQAFSDTSLSFDTRLSALSTTLIETGVTMSKAFTLPLTALGTVATKSAITFESAFAGVRKTVDATSEEYEILSDNIKQMATETASTSAEIAGVMEVAGQLGVALGENGRSLTKFTRTMVELGDTTNLAADEAAVSLAQFSNIMGTVEDDIDRLGSSIVALGNNFATDEQRIVSMSTRLASAGKLAGLTEQQVLALATAMSSVGIEAEAGGTAMTQTLTAIESAVVNGGDSLAQFASIAGMSAQGFATAWRDAPIVALQSFIQGLGALDAQGQSATLMLEEMGLSGIRQSNMLKALALSSENLSKAVEVSNTAWAENVALSKEAEERYNTTESKLKQLKEQFNNVAIEIGEILIPYLEKLVEWLSQLAEWWNSLSDAQKDAVVTIGLVVAALGPLLTLLGSLLKLVTEFKLLGGMTAIFGGVKGGATLAATAQGATVALGGFTNSAVAAGAAAGTTTTLLAKAGGALKSFGGVVVTTGAALATFDLIKNPVINALGAITGDVETSAKMIERYGYAGDTIRIVADTFGLLEKKVSGLPAVLDGAEFSGKALGEALEAISKGVVYTDEQLAEMHERWQLTEDDMETLRQAMIDANPEIVDITDKFTDLHDASAQTMQQVAAGLTAMAEEGKTVDDVLNGNVKTVGNLTQEATSFFRTIQNDTVEVQTALGKVNETIVNQSGQLNEVGKNLVRGYSAGVQSEVPKANEQVKTWMESTNNLLQKNTAQAAVAGQNYILGFNQGIKKEQKTTQDVTAAWMQSTIDTMHKKLDEHSPSRVSEQSAANMIFGFNNGIDNNSKSTLEATSSWLDLLLGALDSATSNKSLFQLGYDTISIILRGMQSGWLNVAAWLSEQLTTLGQTGRTSAYYSGSHANGLDYVPYNGYVAELHQGERVLTREENKRYNEDSNNRGGDVYNFYSPEPIDEYRAAKMLKQTKMALDL